MQKPINVPLIFRRHAPIEMGVKEEKDVLFVARKVRDLKHMKI